MTADHQRSVARISAVVAGVLVIAGALALTVDYAAARVRAAGDTARVAMLQEQAWTDAAAARALTAEQDRITRTRRARKGRSDVLAVLLIPAVAAFVGAVKWQIALGPGRPAAVPLTLVRRQTPAARAAASPPPNPALPGTAAEEIDLTVLDIIIESYGTSREAAIPILQAIQSHYRYLPDEVLRRVCERTDITPAQIAGTSSFYARFRRSPVGEHVVRVCHGTACHVSGARQITEELRRYLRIPDGADTDPARLFTVDEVACLGCCSLAPVLTVNEQTVGRLTPTTAAAALDLVRPRKESA